jgi:hypothetical protein
MAFDKKLPAVSPQLFIADGKTDGRIFVARPGLFKTLQRVVVSSIVSPSLIFEVKRVEPVATVTLGPLDNNLNSRSDLSPYTVVDGATILAAEQIRPFIPRDELVPNYSLDDLTFDEEPVVAKRAILVNELGERIGFTIGGDGKIRLAVNADVSIPFPPDPTSPTIANVAIALPNTEISYALPANTRRFLMKARSNSKLKLSFILGDSGVAYLTIPMGGFFAETGIGAAALTLYFQSSKAPEVVEVLSWA